MSAFDKGYTLRHGESNPSTCVRSPQSALARGRSFGYPRFFYSRSMLLTPSFRTLGIAKLPEISIEGPEPVPPNFGMSFAFMGLRLFLEPDN